MLKTQFDEYVKQYETSDFIDADPVRFVHCFDDKKDSEIAGFIASMFAYGKREVFIDKLNHIFKIMNYKPFEYVTNFDYNDNSVENCDYRFSKTCDFIAILKILNKLYGENETLESLFKYGYEQKNDVWHMFQCVVDYFYANVDTGVTQGFYHLLPNPSKKSALKRMNMMMRWFVRKSDVDIGIWNFIPKSELLIPLDTHVAKTARNTGLLSRNNNDYFSVKELTENLKKFDKNDPVKYDFALFGFGINNNKIR